MCSTNMLLASGTPTVTVLFFIVTVPSAMEATCVVVDDAARTPIIFRMAYNGIEQ